MGLNYKVISIGNSLQIAEEVIYEEWGLHRETYIIRSRRTETINTRDHRPVDIISSDLHIGPRDDMPALHLRFILAVGTENDRFIGGKMLRPDPDMPGHWLMFDYTGDGEAQIPFEWRSVGIGQALMKQAIQQARRQDFSFETTSFRNKRYQAACERWGITIRNERGFFNFPHEAISMQRMVS